MLVHQRVPIKEGDVSQPCKRLPEGWHYIGTIEIDASKTSHISLIFMGYYVSIYIYIVISSMI